MNEGCLLLFGDGQGGGRGSSQQDETEVGSEERKAGVRLRGKRRGRKKKGLQGEKGKERSERERKGKNKARETKEDGVSECARDKEKERKGCKG